MLREFFGTAKEIKLYLKVLALCDFVKYYYFFLVLSCALGEESLYMVCRIDHQMMAS